MSHPDGGVGAVDRLLDELGTPSDDERQLGVRILAAVGVLAARPLPFGPAAEGDPGGSLTAQSVATTVALAVRPRADVLIVVEIAAAALSAPWLADDAARLQALVAGLRIAGRLLPDGLLDAGRDSGSWGAIAAGVGVAPRDDREEQARIAYIAASLALAPVPVADNDEAYLAMRSGHAAASALLAVTLASAGFVGDVEAIDSLHERLGVASASGPRRGAVELARAGLELLEQPVR